FLLRSTGGTDGVLLLRSYDAEREPQETCRVYDASGAPGAGELVPFARSLAGTVVSLQEPYAISNLGKAAADGAVELQPFERGRQSLLAAPIAVAPGVQVVLELFDKKGAPGATGNTAFTVEDQRLAAAAADLGAEMLRQALAERQMQQVLIQAVEAALEASAQVTTTLQGTARERQEQPPPAPVLERRFRQRGQQIYPIAGGIFTAGSQQPLPYEGKQSTPHGTTVADIVLSLAPRVRLYSADVFGPRGSCELDVVMQALHWAIAEWKCKIINLSLGVPEQRLQQVQRRYQFLRAIEEGY